MVRLRRAKVEKNCLKTWNKYNYIEHILLFSNEELVWRLFLNAFAKTENRHCPGSKIFPPNSVLLWLSNRKLSV